MKAVVIGAGLGGLSAACLLAAKGYEVHLFEKNNRAGGKMNILEEKGYRFDTGPSLLTMPFILEELFEACGSNLEDHLELEALSPLCRYFYQDGTIFNNYSDKNLTEKEIRSFAPEDIHSYRKFLNYSESLYEKTSDAFIFNPLFEFDDLRKLNLKDFLKIDAFSSVSERVDEYFQSPYLRKFFKRFTTYNGSSPFLAPATLNVIPHVEINQGGYYVKDGMYKIADALYKLAVSSGVKFHFESLVEKIHVSSVGVNEIVVSGKNIPCDLIVANSDATETITHLLPDSSVSTKRKKKISKIEPSGSGFVILLGVDKKYTHLAHHNIFFSEDYESEFNDIFHRKVMPEDPTIYVVNTSHSDANHAPEGHSNLFVLVNAPYLSSHFDWKEQGKKYGDKVIRKLENRGLDGLSDHIRFRKSITPKDFYTNYLSNKGSIYGTSSNNKFSAFLRPRNKSKKIDGLYFVGGSTHPGGGIPLVIQSAFNAMELIERFEPKP